MHTFESAISWFEIPVVEMDRATRFYETIFNIQMIPVEMSNIRMRLFPLSETMQGVGGALIDSRGFHKPSLTEGPLIYLNANPDMQSILNRIEKSGGAILMHKTLISEAFGFMSVFFDTEGNRIGLHSAG